MGDMIQNALKKMFYVITYYSNGSKYYLSVDGFGLGQTRLTNSYKLSPEYNTRQFASVSTALQFLADVENDRSRSLQLIRVEETPGVEQRVLLGELEAAPSGATVKYALRHDNKDFLKQNGRDCNFFTSVISDVLLVDTHAAAFAALADVQTGGRYGHIRPTIVRIALIPGVPTITETVLA